jgi:SAM-dependent methyltransferase
MQEIKTLEDVREYVQKDYWEEGQSKGISGYEKFEIDWWWNGRLCQALQEAFGLRGKTFLDLGCAYGQLVATARLFGADSFGIDLSDYAIDQGKKSASWLRETIHQGSVHDLKPFPNCNFDFLYSNQVFEHVPGDLCYELATETYRVAKPGAVLWVGLVLDKKNEFPFGYDPEDPDKSHINIRTFKWWDKRFLSAGWEIEESLDEKFRRVRVEPDDYSFFDSYGWHSICYRKGR